MRIDAHQHFTAGYTPDLLVPILKRNRFEGSVVVCGEHDAPRHFQLAAEHDFIRAVVGWADLADPHLGRVLDEYQRHVKFRGITAPAGHDLPEGMIAGLIEGLAELERRNLTLDLPDAALIPRI